MTTTMMLMMVVMMMMMMMMVVVVVMTTTMMIVKTKFQIWVHIITVYLERNKRTDERTKDRKNGCHGVARKYFHFRAIFHANEVSFAAYWLAVQGGNPTILCCRNSDLFDWSLVNKIFFYVLFVFQVERKELNFLAIGSEVNDFLTFQLDELSMEVDLCGKFTSLKTMENPWIFLSIEHEGCKRPNFGHILEISEKNFLLLGQLTPQLWRRKRTKCLRRCPPPVAWPVLWTPRRRCRFPSSTTAWPSRVGRRNASRRWKSRQSRNWRGRDENGSENWRGSKKNFCASTLEPFTILDLTRWLSNGKEALRF